MLLCSLLVTCLCFSIGYQVASDSTFESSVPELYVLDSDGNEKQLENVALTLDASVTLICRTEATDQQLLWEYAMFASSSFSPINSSRHLTIVSSRLPKEISIQLTKVPASVAGKYRCWNGFVGKQVNVHVYGITQAIGSTVQLMEKHEVVGQKQLMVKTINSTTLPMLACKFQVGPYGIKYTTVRWQGGKFKTDPKLYEVSYTADEVNGHIWSNLTLLHPSADQALYGEYRCLFNVVSGSIVSEIVHITIPPLIKEPASVVGHYSGKKYVHTCEVVAYPAIINSIDWKRNDERFAPDGSQPSAVASLKHVRFETHSWPNDRIVFDPVQPEDRAVYSCFVENRLGNATGALYLRVKNKWSMLWPLIGIIVELAILFVVIMVYEMKMRAKAKREREAEQDMGASNKTSSLRHEEDAVSDHMSLRQRPTRV